MKHEFIEERTGSKGTTYRVKVPYISNGERKFHSKSFSTVDYISKKAALDAAKKYRDQCKLENSIDYSKRDKTLDEVFSMWLDSSPLANETKRKRRITYTKYITSQIDPNTLFEEIRYSHISTTINSLKDTKSDDVIKHTMLCWKNMYDFAIKQRIVTSDESRLVDVPKSTLVHRKRNQKTTYEEFEELLLMLDNSSVRDKETIHNLLLVIYYLGLRPAEALALDETCIDHKNQTISIHQAISHDCDRKPYISRTKTSLSNRILPLPDELVSWSKSFKNFRRYNGELMDSNTIASTLNRVSNGTFTMYQLRHLFATDNIEAGTDMRTLQEMMGHASSSMTLSYARSSQDNMRKALINRKKTS